MASSTKDIGIVTFKATGLTAFAVLEEVSVATESELIQTEDESGNVLVDDNVFYKKKLTMTAKGTMATAYSAPSIGDSVTVDSVAYKIRDYKETESKSDKPTFDVTAVHDIITANLATV